MVKTLLQYLFPVNTGELVNGKTLNSKCLYTANKPLFVFSHLQDILQRTFLTFTYNHPAPKCRQLWGRIHVIVERDPQWMKRRTGTIQERIPKSLRIPPMHFQRDLAEMSFSDKRTTRQSSAPWTPWLFHSPALKWITHHPKPAGYFGGVFQNLLWLSCLEMFAFPANIHLRWVFSSLSWCQLYPAAKIILPPPCCLSRGRVCRPGILLLSFQFKPGSSSLFY